MGLVLLLAAAIRLYEFALLARIILSWVNPDPHPRHEMLRFLYRITDPYLNWFRRALPFLAAGGIDFSPIVGFMVLHTVSTILSGGRMF